MVNLDLRFLLVALEQFQLFLILGEGHSLTFEHPSVLSDMVVLLVDSLLHPTFINDVRDIFAAEHSKILLQD